MRPAWALAALLVLAPAGLQAQSLASIPVDSAAPGAATAAATAAAGLRARVHAADAPGLARLLGGPEGQDGAAGSLTLALQPGTHADLAASATAPADALAASFIVDFDAPAVQALRQQLQAESGAAPIDGARIVAFVASRMEASYAANANLASEVARTLRGDCTEYALLTAALARSLGIPARIVHGAALTRRDGAWQAYGHAWVQTYEAGRWTLRDSALAGEAHPVYYVPGLVLTDEGPGYKLGMMLGFGRMPSRLEILY